MAITPKLLGVGSLTSTEASLLQDYNSTSAKVALVVKRIVVTNTSATVTATVNLFVQKQATGDTVQWSPVDVKVPPKGQVVFDTELMLYIASGPDKLTGKKNSGDGTVHFAVNGFVQDL